MAIKKVIDIEVNTGQSVNNIEQMNSALDSTADSAKKVSNNVNDLENATAGGTSSISRGLGKVATGFKGIGLAFKAAGIGLIISAFALLKEALSKNEKVVNFFTAAINTVSSVINQVVDGIGKAISKVSDLTNGFEHTKKVVGGLLTLALYPLKITFYTLVLGIKELQLAWEKSFLGKKDEKTIKSLESDIKGLTNNIKKATEDVAKGTVEIVQNIGASLSEVGQVIEKSIDNVQKIDVKATFIAAQRLESLKKSSAITIATLDKEIAKIQEQVTVQQGLRDDENLTYEQRIKASEDLDTILKQQIELTNKKNAAMLSLAEAENAANKTTESQVAVITAQTEAFNNNKEVLDQVNENNQAATGLTIAFKDEIKELTKTIKESDKAFKQLQLNKLFPDTELLKTRAELKEVNDKLEESTLYLDSLIESGQEWSTTFFNEAKANEKLQERKAQLLQQEEEQVSKLIELEKGKIAIQTEAADNESLLIKQRLDANLEADRLIKESTILTEAERTAATKANIEQRQQLEIARIDQLQMYSEMSLAALSDISATFMNIELARQDEKFKRGQISEELYNKKVEAIKLKAAKRDKALAISSTAINTYASIVRALADPGGIPGTILAVANGIMGAAQLAKIISTPIESLSTPSVDNTGGQGPNSSISTPAQFNVVGTSATNALAESLNQKMSEPIKAYVVSKEISTAQELDRNIIQNATF